jgi:large subunit ribosomal protein L21
VDSSERTKQMSYAIIKTGGKQFVVEEGHTLRIPSLATEAGKSIELNALLTAADGAPVVGDAKVSATVVEHGRGQKLVVFKKKRRKHYKRKQGHRQGYTTIRIDSIG